MHKHQNNILYKPRLIPVPGTDLQWFYIIDYGHIIYYHKASLMQMKRCCGYWAGEKSALRWSTAHISITRPYQFARLTIRSRIKVEDADTLQRHARWELYKMCIRCTNE